MFLVDTNIFLEILLNQAKKDNCKNFLDSNKSNIKITDFSLHSIGVILFKYSKGSIFQKFVEDIIPQTQILSLPIELYKELANVIKNMNLDFDDAYQYKVAKYYGVKVVTMDSDFRRIKDVEILFL